MDDEETGKNDESMNVHASSGIQALAPSGLKRTRPTDLADLEMCIENVVRDLQDENGEDGDDMIENEEFA